MIVALAAEESSSVIPKVSVRALEQFAFGPVPRLLIWMAQINEDSVGTLVGTPIVSTRRGGEGLYVVDLYVEPRARGSGIASSLIGKAMREGAYQFVKLEVASRNDAAIGFYEKRGFSAVAGEQTMFLEASALALFLTKF